jgi:hypothetical protein
VVAPLVLEQELLFLPLEQVLFLLLEQSLPEQVAPFVQVDPSVQLEPLVQVVPLLQLLPLPLLQPSLLKMLLISPDCPKQFEMV